MTRYRVVGAFVFLSGVVTAFAFPALAEGSVFWAAVGAVLILAAWGWRLRGWAGVALFAAGFVCAQREQARLSEFLDRMFGTARGAGTPVCEVRVTECLGERIGRNGRRLILFDADCGAVPLRVSVPAATGAPLPEPGERWSCAGWLGALRKGAHRFSRRPFRVVRAEDARRLAPAAGSSAHFFARLREALSERAGRGLDRHPALASLNRAILFGERSRLSPAQREAFANAGTIHVFAISGLHVMMVAGLVIEALGLCGLGLRARVLAALPLVAGYVLLTGARPSAVRAALMAAFGYSAVVFGRRPALLSGWAYAVFLVYGARPRLVFDVGCTLSFVVMFGIGLWLARPQRGSAAYDLLSRKALVAPVERYGLERWLWLKGNFGVSCAAWAAGVPITVIFFERFTVGSLAANIAVVPLAAFTVITGMTGVAVGFVSSVAGACFNNLAALGTYAMKAVSAEVASWPGASFPVEAWPPSAVAAWYLGCLAVCGLGSFRGRIGKSSAARFG